MTDDTTDAALRRGSPSRVLAFSDGMFAIVITILVLEVGVPPDLAERRRAAERMQFQHAEVSALGSPQQAQQPQASPPPVPETFRRDGRKIGRNEPCPCGSGKKFKQCHGKLG